MTREAERTTFLVANGHPSEGWQPLSGDASARRYFRPPPGVAAGLMLMDSPPSSEPLGPYLRIARHLVDLGLSAPRIHAADEALGLALIEDFGDDTFTRRLAADPREEAALYHLATDTLAALHLHPRQTALPDPLPVYDAAELAREAALFIDWYLPESQVGAIPAESRANILAALAEITADTADRRDALVLKDFHVDNLMVLPDRQGPAACGLLDFQDGLLGSPAYDLMSLLEDARRDVPEALAQDCWTRYVEALGLDMDFDTDFVVLAAQRHLKVAGIFVRLWRRDGKPIYLQHIPRVLRLLDRALANQACRPLARALDHYANGWRSGVMSKP